MKQHGDVKSSKQLTKIKAEAGGYVCLLTHFREINTATYSQSLEKKNQLQMEVNKHINTYKHRQTAWTKRTLHTFIFCYTIYIETLLFPIYFCYCIVSSLLCIFSSRFIHSTKQTLIYFLIFSIFCYRFMVNNIICK